MEDIRPKDQVISVRTPLNIIALTVKSQPLRARGQLSMKLDFSVFFLVGSVIICAPYIYCCG